MSPMIESQLTKMEGGVFLGTAVREGAAILEPLANEDLVLPVRGDALLVLNLGLNIVDGIGGLNLKGDCLTCRGLDEDLLNRGGEGPQRKK